MERRTPEAEATYRRNQKREEIQEAVAVLPATVDEFITSPKWYRNAQDNPVHNTPRGPLTIFRQYGKLNWIIGGGKPKYGPGGFVSEDEAKRALWDELHRESE